MDEGLALELPPETRRILQFIADAGVLGYTPGDVASYLVLRGLDDMMRSGALKLGTSLATPSQEERDDR